MKTKLLATWLLTDLFLCVSSAHGQSYCPPGCPPQLVYNFRKTTPLQTLLFVRIAGPDGMKVTFYRGLTQAVQLDTPCVVAMRPGYFYRVALSHMKDFPEQVFYPTLEVRGSLLLAGNLRACNYPAGLLFKAEDFAQVQNGSMLTKVIYVEKVDRALPQSSSPEKPLEIVVPRGKDPLREARERGLPVMIVEMGQRKMETQELLGQAISGTILLPGDAYLPLPSRIPCMPWSCYPLYDPIHGPAPWLYYTLPDGGDWGSPAAVDRNGNLVGLDPADTIAKYKTSRGVDKVAVSNRVCLCIPRFVVARSEVSPPHEMELSVNVRKHQTLVAKADMQSGKSLKANRQERHLELTKAKIKASELAKSVGTIVMGKIQSLDVRTKIVVPANVVGTPKQQAGPEEEAPDAPLEVDKWPDCCGGVVGSVITFFIRYTNRGGRDISNVVVLDSLISRFEYVKGSAKTSRPANFTVQPNEVGSEIVRWEIEGVLRPGESGTVSFQVRIR